jgi:transcriptional regulator with XRE-family HTH domain
MSPISVRFGLRLRTLRRSRGFTQVQLADLLGIDRSYISALEQGHKAPTLSYLETVAQGFKLSMSELLHDL